MTDTQALRNRVKLAMAKSVSLHEAADAAIAVCMEEAAGVADDYPQRDPGGDGNGYWAAEEIASAIRALKPKTEG